KRKELENLARAVRKRLLSPSRRVARRVHIEWHRANCVILTRRTICAMKKIQIRYPLSIWVPQNTKKYPNQLGLVYSQFVGVGGLGTFSRYLESQSWERVHVGDTVATMGGRRAKTS